MCMETLDYEKSHWKQKPCPKVDCHKDDCKCGLKKVVLPGVLGDDSKDSSIAPKNGAYCNAIVAYEANGHVYIYSQEGIPTLVESEGSNIEDTIKKIEDSLAQEILDRQAADNVLQGEIDDIKNSPDVVDIVATYAALQVYDTSKLGDNDVIRVLADETHDGQSTYYRWDKQNSTWTYIGAVGDYYTKGQVDTLLADKQDKLTAGTNISIAQVDNDLVISATDTTYSDFVGTDGIDAGTAGLVPAPATTDAGKFLKADGTWDTAGGGSSVTVVQTTGTSQTDVMSQNAVTNMIYKDPGTNNKIVIGTGADASTHSYNMAIGTSASANGTQSTAVGYIAKARPNGTALGYDAQAGTSSSHTNTTAIGRSAYGGGDHCTAVGDNSNTINSYSTAIGASARARSERSVAIGASATVENSPAMAYSVALGAGAITSRAGEVNVGTGTPGVSTVGYNSTSYRVIGGVHDGVDNHDAVTKGQLDSIAIQNAGAPTTATVGAVGQLLEDTTNGKLYQCTAVDNTDPNAPVYTWTEVGGGGSSINVVQTTGTSTTDVMSQNAATKLVYVDPSSPNGVSIGTQTTAQLGNFYGVAIGSGNYTLGSNNIAIGRDANAGNNANRADNIAIGREAAAAAGSHRIAIGNSAGVANDYSVALGAGARTSRVGEVNVGTGSSSHGYNSTSYRVIGGVHDGQGSNDAVTVGQVNSVIDAINTALSTNISHIGA